MPSLFDFYISSHGALTLPVNTVTYNDGGTTNLDHGLGNVFSLNANGTGTTIAHLNVPSERYSFELHLLQWISGTITWPTSWTKGDTAPTATGGYVITGTTVDGGISWKISVLSAGLWTPAYITTSLWLDAADNSTITTVSGAVSQWNDKSGNSRNITQATSTSRPSYNLTGFNNRPTITFDGSDDFLENSTSGITSGTYTGRLNCFYVATRNSNGGAVLTERLTAPVATFQWVFISPLYYIYSDGAQFNSNQGISSTTFAKLSTTGATVCQIHQPGVRAVLFVNGTQETVNAAGGAGVGSNISGTTGFRVGAREGAVGQRWNGSISEIIVTTNVLTTLERQKIEGYLAHKWGLTGNLPSDHPYKNTPPIS